MIAPRSARFGFSLMELLVVIVILGTLAAMIVPRVTNSANMARNKSDMMNRAQINSAVERYYMEHGTWPADNLNDLAADPDYFPSGIPINPMNNTAYTLNPITHRVKPNGGGK